MGAKSNIKWNPFSAGYFENPYPHLEDCRLHNPVQQTYDNAYFFFRYDHINTYLKEKDFKVHSLSEYLGEKEAYIFKSTENACPYLKTSTELWPMYLSDDVHRKVRTAITKAFHSISYEDLIAESLDITLDLYKNKDAFNLVDFCGKFIYYFLKKALNINDDDYDSVQSFSNLLARVQDLYIPKQTYQEINTEILFRKNNIFKNSVFKDVLLKETESLNLNDDQIYSIMLVSFMAAFETSKDNLSLSLYEILKKPELVDALLKTDKNGIKKFCEEAFRYSSPLQFTVRINPYPLDIAGHHIPANSKLYLCVASANRDKEVFKQPNELIHDREHNPHLAFGAGVHQCLGATIARQEVELCLQPMIHFLKDYDIVNIKWSKQILMRTAKEVTVQKKK